MKVTFRFDGATSTAYYRCQLPAKGLKYKGHEVEQKREFEVEELDGFPLRSVVDSDVVVTQRPLHKDDDLFCRLPSDALKVVEFDDDFFNLQDWSPLLTSLKLQNFVPMERLKNCLRNADLITVTTPELADLYSAYNKKIAVLPNHVDLPVWEMAMARGQALKQFDRLRIGWAGWAHGYDLEVLRGVVDDIVNTRSDVDFYLVGWPEAKAKFNCPSTVYDWMPIHMYRPIVGSFDIGLAPLQKCKFNAGKSWLKALEYMACGVVPIVDTWHPDYNRLVKDGENGLVARGKKGWRECIETLLTDHDLRNRLRSNALATAKNYGIPQAGFMWESAYTKALY